MTDPTTAAAALEDRLNLIDSCTRMAWLADRRDWDALVDLFNDEITIDYTSLTSGEPTQLPCHRLVTGWTQGLGALTVTRHLAAGAAQ